MEEKAARRLAALQADIARYRRPNAPPAFAFHPGAPQPCELPAEPFTPPPMPTPDECLARIVAHDGAIRAFVQVHPRPAAGIPIAVKDVYDVAGQPTTAGSRLRQSHVASQDCAVVARLRRAGAVIIGKTATHEFAYGTTTDSPFHGPVHNPLDRDRTPGGSSGGSAAAVAAGMVPIALGTDTAGSVRIPAACCGVVGFKPTCGSVPTGGIVPLSWSLDHPGPIGRTVGHVALALSLMTDFQPGGLPATLAGVRIGVPAAWLETPLEPEVRSAFQSTIDQLQMLRAQVQLVELPALERLHFVSRIITLAEAAAYHAPNLDRLADYAPDVATRVELGQHVLARDYLLAQQIRTELCRETAEAIAGVDVLVTPTLPIPAPLIGQRVWTYPDGRKEPVAEALTRFVAPFNVTGQPAISLPPGVQLVARVGADGFLLQVAGALERRLNEITPPA